MSITDAGTEVDVGLKRPAPTILRHGFRHPRSEPESARADCGRTIPPQIKWRACSWDVIDDERTPDDDRPGDDDRKGGDAP